MVLLFFFLICLFFFGFGWKVIVSQNRKILVLREKDGWKGWWFSLWSTDIWLKFIQTFFIKTIIFLFTHFGCEVTIFKETIVILMPVNSKCNEILSFDITKRIKIFLLTCQAVNVSSASGRRVETCWKRWVTKNDEPVDSSQYIF